MSDILERKCGHCKQNIIIERNNISNVLYFDKKYFHNECFPEAVKTKPLTKAGKPSKWHKALDNIPALERKAKEELEYWWMRDDFNNWLLAHYDIVAPKQAFWAIVCDIENGKFRNKKCNPVPLETIAAAWYWGQKRLDEIDIRNKKNHKGPKNDDDRLLYDLSIIISKIPNYLAHVNKMKALEASTAQAKQETKINYANLEKPKNTNQLNDIYDLLDEVF